MRALVISAVLLAAVMIFVFSSSAWLSGFFSRLYNTANDLPDTAENADVSELYDLWYGKKTFVLLVCDKEEIDYTERALERLKKACSDLDEKEYSAAKSELLYEIIRMKTMLTPNLKNVL